MTIEVCMGHMLGHGAPLRRPGFCAGRSEACCLYMSCADVTSRKKKKKEKRKEKKKKKNKKLAIVFLWPVLCLPGVVLWMPNALEVDVDLLGLSLHSTQASLPSVKVSNCLRAGSMDELDPPPTLCIIHSQ